MPTIQALREWADFQIKAGRGELHTQHPIVVEHAAKERAENKPDEQGKRKTRIVWDAGDPEMFKEFHVERELYMKACGANPTIATSLMIKALRMFRDEGLLQAEANQ